jgi:hypothetical protein
MQAVRHTGLKKKKTLRRWPGRFILTKMGTMEGQALIESCSTPS